MAHTEKYISQHNTIYWTQSSYKHLPNSVVRVNCIERQCNIFVFSPYTVLKFVPR